MTFPGGKSKESLQQPAELDTVAWLCLISAQIQSCVESIQGENDSTPAPFPPKASEVQCRWLWQRRARRATGGGSQSRSARRAAAFAKSRGRSPPSPASRTRSMRLPSPAPGRRGGCAALTDPPRGPPRGPRPGGPCQEEAQHASGAYCASGSFTPTQHV